MKTLRTLFIAMIILVMTQAMADVESTSVNVDLDVDVDENIDDLSLLQVQKTSDDIALEKRLARKKTFLRWHEYAGYASVALLAASFPTAPKKKRSTTHNFLGIGSGVAYLASAMFLWAAPSLEGAHVKRNVYWHGKLAWIHFPAMILTGVTGYLADQRLKEGKKISGLYKSHKAFPAITAISLGLSVAILHIEF